jgi:predicted Zn-dependent protease
MFTVYMFNDQIDTAKSLIMSYPVDNSSAYDLAEYSRMLITVEEWDKAFENLKKAWNIDKDEYKIYDVLAQASSFNKDNVLEKISALSSKNPDDICYKMWLAKVYSLDTATAETANKYVTDLKKSSVGKIEIKLIEAAVLQNLNKEKEADELISTVIKENPNDYRILHTAGWYYLNKNKLDLAEKYCKESILKNKNYPDNYSFLMPKIMEKQGKVKEAEPYFRTGISKEPYNYNIMLSIADHYLQVAKDSNKAMEYYRFAEKIRPKDGEIKYSIAFIYIHDGKQNEAIDMLNQCIAINESIPKYHRTLGAIYLLQGKNDEGIQQTKLAYSLDERDILTLNNAGVYYLTVSVEMDRSLSNFKSAFEGISASTDQYTKDTITANYNKVKKLVDDYNNSNGNEEIKIPELTLFY